jgi:peptide chain release factor 3
VGPLQFEVMADRLKEEFQLDVIFEDAPFAEARWLAGDERRWTTSRQAPGGMAEDIDEQPVFLAKSAWEIGYVAERYPKVRFERTKERG